MKSVISKLSVNNTAFKRCIYISVEYRKNILEGFLMRKMNLIVIRITKTMINNDL